LYVVENSVNVSRTSGAIGGGGEAALLVYTQMIDDSSLFVLRSQRNILGTREGGIGPLVHHTVSM
jgi:hypothetical protein